MEQLDKMLDQAGEDTAKAKSIIRTINSLPQDELKRIIGEVKYTELQGKIKVLQDEIDLAEKEGNKKP